MKQLFRSVLILLTAVLLFSTCACEKASDPSSTVGELIDSASLPENATVREWFRKAQEREQLTNALLYSKDSDGLWHCWLYIASYRDGDSISHEVNGDGVTVISATLKDPDATDCNGAHYFTLTSDTEPEFELEINGSFAPMLVTHAISSVKK